MEYLDSRIASANDAQLVAIMYEGLIKRIEDSIENIKNNDKKKLSESIIKSRNIIAELLATLEGNSEIAMNYRSLYIYLNKLITKANTSMSVKSLEEAIQVIKPLYEGWTELGERIFEENIEKGKEKRVVAGMTYGKGCLNDDTSCSGNTFEA